MQLIYLVILYLIDLHDILTFKMQNKILLRMGMTASSLPWHGVQKHKGHSEEWPLLFDVVPGSLSKCEPIQLIYIDTNQAKPYLYPQKYPHIQCVGVVCSDTNRNFQTMPN